jgi:hypothetical protein
VTFVDPAAAFTFFQVASYQGLTLNNRRLKIGWGKNSGPLPTTLALAVHAGATRNVYIGNVEDFETFTEERLKRDFGEFGDIELVNFLKEKCVYFCFFYGALANGSFCLMTIRNCAFVNFTNVANAIKAIEGVKNKPEYANLRIAHGKDRCANPPRSGPQGGSGVRRASGGHGGVNGHGHGHGRVNGQVNGVGGGMGVMGDDGEMQFLNDEVGEDDDGMLEAIADAEGMGVGAGEVQEMHVDGKEPVVIPIVTAVVV